MAIENYPVRPRGLNRTIIKFRVRIRTKDEEGASVEYPVGVFDTYPEAKKAEEEFWMGLRGGTVIQAIKDAIKRETEPCLRELLCRRAFKFDHLCSLNFDQV